MRLPYRVGAGPHWWVVLGVVFGFAALAGPAAGASDGSQARQWHSYLQVRATAPEGEGSYLSLRRLKAYGTGPVGRGGWYYLQLIYKDGNRSSTDGRLFLQEAWLKRAVGRGSLAIGQMKPPFGLERFISDTVLPLIDRSQGTDRLVPNGSLGRSFTRDLGLQWDRQMGSVSYSVGAFAGCGANEPVRTVGPLFALRLQWDGVLPHRPTRTVAVRPSSQAAAGQLRVAAAVSWRRDSGLNLSSQLPGSGVLGYRQFVGRDVRETVGFRVVEGNATLQGEGFLAQYHSGRSDVPSTSAAAGYLLAAYRWCSSCESAVRLEAFGAGLHGTAPDGFRAWTMGVSYRLHGGAERLQLDYTRQEAAGPEPSRGTWLLQYQRNLLN